MVKIKDTQFCVKNLKMKRKKEQKNFDLPKRGFSWKVRETRSNQNKLLKEIGLYIGFQANNTRFLYFFLIFLATV